MDRFKCITVCPKINTENAVMLKIEWMMISCPEKLKQTLVFTSATSPDLMSDQDLYAVIEIAEMFHFENKLPST